MLYSVADYQKEFHPTKSVRTVHRMIKSGFLPEGHNRIFISRILLVETCPCYNYEPYIRAIRDYCRENKTPVNLELSTECGINNNVESIRFLNEVLGY